MIKLNINKAKLDVLCSFSSYVCKHVETEICKIYNAKKTLEIIQLRIQLEEIRMLKDKFEVLQIRKINLPNRKVFVAKLSPIQSLLILTYAEPFMRQTKEPFSLFTMNEQKDFIFQRILSHYL